MIGMAIVMVDDVSATPVALFVRRKQGGRHAHCSKPYEK